SGIITMVDAIDSLIGVEITDESDLVADLRQLARQRYQRQLKLLGILTDTQEISTRPPQAGESQLSRPRLTKRTLMDGNFWRIISLRPFASGERNRSRWSSNRYRK